MLLCVQNYVSNNFKVLKTDRIIEYLHTAIMEDNKVYSILDATSSGDADNDGVVDKAGKAE